MNDKYFSCRTKIITFDSLDVDRSGAITTLDAYLKMEAKDKESVDARSNAIGFKALV